MPSLKDLRDRIKSVKSTKKITSAMKMVAASKLRRAQEQAEAGQPYAERMAAILGRLADNVDVGPETSPLLIGTGKEDVHLLVVVSSDRGLCGGFNTNLIRKVRQTVLSLNRQNKTVKMFTVGRKAKEGLRADFSHLFIGHLEDVGKPALTFQSAADISQRVLAMFDRTEFDVCTVLYNCFNSVIAQVPTAQQIIPFSPPKEFSMAPEDPADAATGLNALYEFEPDQDRILEELLPRNLSVQIFRALLDSAAGEQAARMTAMDNATRNAGDMIKGLTLTYNRERQAYITKELIEIISGAEAV